MACPADACSACSAAVLLALTVALCWRGLGCFLPRSCRLHDTVLIQSVVAIRSNSKRTLMYLVGSCLCLDWTLCFAGKIQELQSLLHCNHNCTNLSEEICLHSQSTCLNTQCVVGISDLHSLASSVLNHLVDQSIARVMALLINLAKVYPL